MARKKGSKLTAEQRLKCRPNPVTQAQLDSYLQLYGEMGLTSVQAAKKAGITLMTVSRRKKSDPEFAARWQQAYDGYTDYLESRAEEMAGTCDRFSPTMLIFLLKARKPQTYRDHLTVNSNVTHEFASSFAEAMAGVTGSSANSSATPHLNH